MMRLDVMLFYAAKTLGDLFLVVGIGLPASLFFINQENRYYLAKLILGAAIFSGFFIYLVFFISTNLSTLSLSDFQVIFVLIFSIPFLLPRTRSNLKGLISKFRGPHGRLSLFEICVLAIVVTIVLAIFVISVQSTPILDDPLTVWLYLGKNIYVTGKMPLFFGNAADVSESGNYPPMAPFVAASTFFLFHNLNPSNYTLIPYYYGVLCVLAVALLVKELGGRTESALIAALVLLVTSIFSLEMLGFGYTDTLDAFYVIAFLTFVFSKSEFRSETAILSLIALACGIASKYDVLLLLVPSLLLFLYLRRNFFSFGGKKTFATRIIILSGVLAVMASWFVRNWKLVGDPIYPFLYTIFRAKGIVPSIKELVPLSAFPTPPFSPLFVLSDRTFLGLTNEGNLWSLLFLGLGGAAYFLYAKKKEGVRPGLLSLWSLASLGILFGFWETLGGYERYLLLAIPSLAVLSGLVYEKLSGISWSVHIGSTRTRNLGRIYVRYVLLLFIIILSLSSLTAIFITQSPTYQNPALVQSWDYVNSLPEGLVATNDIRLFYANQPIVQFYNIPSFFNATSPHAAYLDLKSSHVNYIYFNSRFDFSILESHSFLLQILDNTSYVTSLSSFEQGANTFVTVYKVN